MTEALRAVVVGAGWAGEGHTRALQWCGVEVVAICARQPGAVRQVADRLGIPEASTDWRETIERLRPDIVAVGTPAALRREVVEVAAGLGSHLLCDKPLAVTAEEAAELYHLAEDAGVKHAFGTAHLYDPSTQWLGELVREGAVGRLREAVFTYRAGQEPLRPFSWYHRVDLGGGRTANSLPHYLGILGVITGGEPMRVMGTASTMPALAPVVPDIHDFRAWIKTVLAPEQLAGTEWRERDADQGYTALVQVATPSGDVEATITHNLGIAPPGDAPGWRLYGDEGTLFAEGVLSYKVSRVRAAGQAPEPLPVPPRLTDALPRVGDDVQNKWCALARDFVADVRGESHRAYLTFRDGWRYQAAVDAIRSRQGWTDVPAEPSGRTHVATVASD